MPFPWRLKKARKYDISTKNLFIVGVYLLDNVYLECTLNAESTGQECLNSIAQRIELTESHFFGLRYVTKKLHFHWVDLEKPLKKQLEKYAQQASPSHCLYFGVMFYVSGAHKIPDDVARYHYYLQLKNDVIDGRLPCSVEQAIRLAAYSLQADFGDYEQDKYSAEEYPLYPKAMMQDDATASELLSEAIAGHARLQGIPPDRAELQYVKEVQMMDGYGAEYYSAKDESRKDLYLGTSYAGIFARYIDGQSTVYYRWNEIAKVNHSKKVLEVDTPKSSVQFQMEDTDTSKYVSRMAQLQRQFYKSSKANLSNSLADVNVNEETESQTFIDAQPVYIPPIDSSQSNQELGHSQTSLTPLQMQGYAQEILQSSQQSLASSSSSQHQQEIQQQQQIHNFQMQQQTNSQALQQPSSQSQQSLQHHNNIITIENENVQHGERHDSMTPTPDTDPVYVNRASLLPAYRPSPDYETVMRQRMLQQEQHQQQHHEEPQQHQQQQHLHHQHHHHFTEINTHLGPGQVYVHPEGMAYSQPEIRQNVGGFGDDHSNYANVEALRNYSHSIYANIFHDNHNLYAGQGGGRLSNLAAHPTYSSPELNTEINQQGMASFGMRGDIGGHQQSVPYHYKPPPPYPRNSSSTPDLAAQGSEQSSIIVSNVSGSQENMQVQNIVLKSHVGRNVEDMSAGLPENIYMALSSYPPNVLQNHSQQQQSVNPEDRIPGIEDDDVDNDFDENADDKRSTLTRDSVAPVEDVSDGMNKVLSDDQDDTSSEHSYSTFHAKESEESSDDDTVSVQPKVLPTLQQKEEPKIHIRILTAQEAPPPSKIKEEATLRESFRRLKIARVSSMDRSRQLQASLKGVKETSESELSLPPSTQENNQVLQSDGGVSGPLPTGASDSITMTSHMKEVLDRLGAPPPYPGTATHNNNSNPEISHPPSFSLKTNNSDSSNVSSKEYSVHNNNNNKRELPAIPASKQQQQSQITVKRSSSVGTTPSNQGIPFLPPRRQLPEKPRAATFNLDTIVPVSKPGMVLFRKDSTESDTGTSVLKADGTDGRNGTKDFGGNNEHPKIQEDHNKDRVDSPTSSLHHDYSVGGSDSDSDGEQGSYDGLHMGPLKMAAMNGLTLSRSVVLSLMNDDSRAPTDDRRRMLESKISEGQVYIEFEKIPKKSENLECNVANSVLNGYRNRFKDVLPYDLSRVKLSPRNDNPDGYINASHIKLTANDKQWLFIGTQAPLSNTTSDFWQMIWENKTDVIAMLTPFQEMGKSKCFVYWPQEPGAENKHKYRDFEVELQFTDDSLCYVTSRIILRHCPTDQIHVVWHLQYTDWPDHGCPEDTYGFLGFVDEIESVARLAEMESGRGQASPVVIHCSAGVGRTGVVILTMVMKWCLEHNHNVDLPKALAGIRNQRMHMVQTMGQYRFIHDTLIQYLKNTRLI